VKDKKKICVVTGTRAEYGLLKPVMDKLNKDENFELVLVATGMHLSEHFGNTYKEIEMDGFTINHKIEALAIEDTKAGMARAIGRATCDFADYFENNLPDMLIVLGDRYEIFAAATAAAVEGIPIAHIHGGEVTEGAVDDFFRHSITKMSTLHFTSANEYKERVLDFGENPENVYNVGALGVENIMTLPLLCKKELALQIGFNLDKPYALVTFHPETVGMNNPLEQLLELFEALDSVQNMNFIITKANSDAFGRKINMKIDEYVETHTNTIAFTSMGVLKYLSTMKYCSMVIGNSSSGILEAPVYCIPTINIGNRQKGRVMPKSVINCRATKEDILKSIEIARTDKFLENIKNQINVYGDGTTSEKIMNVLHKYYHL
jgi:GDP/UDP-N,N'-diacetylbacillosamine 2-epimerase (hydrolysing)